MKTFTLKPHFTGQYEQGSVIYTPRSTGGFEFEKQPNQKPTETNTVAAVLDLTLEICAENGSRTRFYQNDQVRVSKTMLQLATSRLFSQPLFTLASEHSVSVIPCRTVDLILAHTQSPAPLLPLPAGWVDAVEVGSEALLENTDAAETPATMDEGTALVEIHTVGDWMIRLKLEITKRATIQEQRQLWIHLIDLPVIPFRLEAAGIGFINPSKISRVTLYPPIEGVTETALQADLLQCIRS
jgi:hypothetical protein